MASGQLFTYYDNDIFIFKQFSKVDLPDIFFNSIFDKLMEKKEVVKRVVVREDILDSRKDHYIVEERLLVQEEERPLDPIYITVTEEGFFPEEVIVKRNQSIVWLNDRKKLTLLVLGLREIDDLDSDFLQPGESFSWQFSEKGVYTYVDGVMIGRVGKVVVQ